MGKVISLRGHAAGRDVKVDKGPTNNVSSISGGTNFIGNQGPVTIHATTDCVSTDSLIVNVKAAPRRGAIQIAPAPGTIGANGGLCLRIDGLLKEIEEHRHARLGKTFKFGVIHGQMASAFGFKPRNWRSIWLLDEVRAPEVIGWLESRRDNTQGGRIARATQRDDQHTRGHLFRIEKELLQQLEWDSDKARNERLLVTGMSSRTDMSDNQFSNWVAHLRSVVRRIYGE